MSLKNFSIFSQLCTHNGYQICLATVYLENFFSAFFLQKKTTPTFMYAVSIDMKGG